jgi:hypothetical protein
MNMVSPSILQLVVRTSLTLDAGVLGTTNNRLDELVGNILSVAVLDGLEQVFLFDLFSLAIGKGVNGKLDSIPSLIAVHSVVPAGDRADLSYTDLLYIILELCNVFCGGPRRSVTAITNVVDVDMFDLMVLCASEESKQVLDVRMHTSIGDETKQMETRSVRGRTLHGFDNGRLLFKFVLLDCFDSARSLNL